MKANCNRLHNMEPDQVARMTPLQTSTPYHHADFCVSKDSQCISPSTWMRTTQVKKGRFYFHNIAKRLGKNVSTVHDFWQQWSWEGNISQENYRPTIHGSPLTEMAGEHRSASAAEIGGVAPK
ncbi:hypothetical protein TNCV_3638001 [Trichonephila clavipes]|nr:hypothetical protein TNCV_3638001 [Trichonephila clavipes]